MTGSKAGEAPLVKRTSPAESQAVRIALVVLVESRSHNGRGNNSQDRKSLALGNENRSLHDLVALNQNDDLVLLDVAEEPHYLHAFVLRVNQNLRIARLEHLVRCSDSLDYIGKALVLRNAHDGAARTVILLRIKTAKDTAAAENQRQSQYSKQTQLPVHSLPPFKIETVIAYANVKRRSLDEFDHDETRNHSPIIHKMGKVIIIESKSIHECLNQMEELGEVREEYDGLYGYSLGQTEHRVPVYEYPEYEYQPTDTINNLEV